MCGFFVETNFDYHSCKKLSAIKKNLKRRGPDNISEANVDGNYFLHSRLSIISLDAESNQPMISWSGRYVILFNGEIYNFKSLALKFFGDEQIKSDTRLIIELWEKLEDKSLDYLRGIFSFVIYDKYEKSIVAIRDRFGVKPLYYSIKNEQLCIASDIKCLLPKEPRANLSVIANYLEKSIYDVSDETFFEDIISLKPSTLLRYCTKTKKIISIKKWYSLRDKLSTLDIDNSELNQRFNELVDEAVNLNLVADVDIGLSISGGIDSGILTKKLDLLGMNNSLYHLNFQGYSELEFIDRFETNKDINVLNISESLCLNLLEATFEAQSQPFGGVMVIAYNELYKKVREDKIKVMLDGNGLDEILMGYEKYKFLQANQDDKEFLQTSIDGTHATMSECVGNKLRSYLGNHVHPQNVTARDRSIDDLLINKTPRSLRFTDHQSMYHGVEVRVPYLDHHLVEFCCSLPASRLIVDRGTKVIARDLLFEKTNDAKLAYGIKRSIQNPQREWFTQRFGKLTKEIINSDSCRQRGWIDVNKANEYVDQALQKRPKNSNYLWQWLSLELWARKFLDGSNQAISNEEYGKVMSN